MSESDRTAEQVGVYQAAEPWTTAATWNTYDGTNSWGTPGGDVSGPVEDVNSYGSAGDVGSYSYWSVVPSTQAWDDGNPSQMDGFVLKPTNPGGVTDVEGFAGGGSSTPPFMEVYYDFRGGDDTGERYVSQSLTDRSSVGVNDASGNMQYSTKDLALPGVNGLGLNLGRSYNNLEGGDQGSVGLGWSLGTGPDTFVVLPADHANVADYFDGAGGAEEYQTNPSGVWVAPAGEDANISMNSSTTAASTSFSLFFRHSGITETFTTTDTTLPKTAYLSSLTDRNGNTLTYHYSSPGVMSSIVDSFGNTTSITWTGDYISKIVDPTGRTYQYAQNSDGQLTGYTDPNSKTTYYAYDSDGNLNKVTTAAGNVTKIAYDTGASERVTSITRLVHPTDSTGPTTSFTYAGPESPCPTADAGWKTTTATDPDSHASTYCSDDLGRVEHVFDANGHERSASYTADGFAASSTSGLGTATAFSYSSDGKDNVTQIQQGTGSGALTEGLQYTDTTHNPYLPTTATDAQSNQTTYAYGTTGNLTSVTDQLSSQNQATLTYNTNGTFASSTNAVGSVTTYGYTGGDLTSVTPPSVPTGDPSGLNPVSVTYDSANRVVKISTVSGSLAGGREVDYTYDPFDRITNEVYKNAAGSTVATLTYTYDADGNLTQMTDPHGTTTYSYDGLGRLTGQTLPDSSTDSYGYDAASNLTTLTDAGGSTSYGYDPANQLTSVTDPGASSATTLSYDADGNLKTIDYPSGATVAWAYNSLDQVTNVADTYNLTGGGTYAVSYAYSYANSLIHTITDNASNVTTYTYDPLNRLTDAKIMNGTTQIRDNAYTLDGNGNIVRSTLNGSTTSYAYNPDNQICWSYTGTSTNGCSSAPTGASTGYSYNADGNETTDAGNTLSYNALDQLTSETAGSTTTNFTYAGEGNNQLTADGTTSLHNDLLGIGYTKTGTNSTYFTRDTNGTQIDERTPTGTYNYLYDGQGNIVGLTDTSGHLVKQYAYDPYGNVTYSPGTITSPFTYQDGYQTSTGLNHFGARYQDPTQTAWTQQDPLNQATDLTQDDRYVYAAADPINETDPYGQNVCKSVFASVGLGSACKSVSHAGSALYKKAVSLIHDAETDSTTDLFCAGAEVTLTGAGALSGGVPGAVLGTAAAAGLCGALYTATAKPFG